jgi:hypothetical protein
MQTTTMTTGRMGSRLVAPWPNVAGTYGYVGFGTALAGNSFGFTGTWSSEGTLTFDGKGNLSIIDTARIDDHILYRNQSFPSTYTVDAQCNLTFTFNGFPIPGPHFKGVFVNNRKGIRTISLLQFLVVNYVNTTRI